MAPESFEIIRKFLLADKESKLY